MRITFLHPDLGIGGAERLVVDAAIALQKKGHEVSVVTAQYDPSHAFEETSLLKIRVIKWFPRDVLGRFFAFCAYVRMCLAALFICFRMESDVVICDQVSACLFIFKLFSSARRVFYCHHPDLLLTDRKTALKSVYRLFLDAVEEKTTALADTICVNSEYTGSVVRNTFPSLKGRPLTVLYPSLNTKFFDEMQDVTIEEVPATAKYVFLSLNRFEVKKRITLALEAFAGLRDELSQEEFEQCFLVVAGGYDKHNQENLVYYHQLRNFAVDCQIPHKQVAFLRSPSDAYKVSLMRRSTAVLYTPENEHFGIVPVEAMYLGKPVIAANSGGPMESIDNGFTGFLVEPNSKDWATTMTRLIREPGLVENAAKCGPERVRKLFAFESFAERLDRIVRGDPMMEEASYPS